jgi:hypothetical protein
VLLLILVAAAILIYTLAILPDQVTYVQLSNQKAANQAKIEDLQRQLVDPDEIAKHFQEIRGSLDQFRGAVLRPRDEGRIEILNAIDRATRETGARLTDTVKFTSEQAEQTESAERGGKKVRKSDENKAVLSYPSLEMEISVAGSYNQVRSFISRFEGSNQFVVIDKVSLSKEDSEENLADGRGAPRSAGEGMIVLSITMTAFFQPDGYQAAGVVH